MKVPYETVADLFVDRRQGPSDYVVSSTAWGENWEPMTLTEAAELMGVSPHRILIGLKNKPPGHWYAPRKTSNPRVNPKNGVDEYWSVKRTREYWERHPELESARRPPRAASADVSPKKGPQHTQARGVAA